MSTKRSPESRILDYFAEQPLDVALAIFAIVRSTLKKRESATVATLVQQPRRRKAKRVSKVEPETVKHDVGE